MPLKKPIPVKVSPAPDPSGDYLNRALLAGALSKSSCALSGMFAREAARDALAQRVLTSADAAKASSSKALDVLDSVVSGVLNGTDLSPQYPEIARLIHAQEQRAEVVNQLLLTHDYARVTRATKARDRLEEDLCTMALNGDLLPAEKVLLMEKLDTIVTTTRKGIAAESTSITDIVAMLDKMDYATEIAGAGLQRKFEKTSPQGREVARKLLLNISKRVSAATKEKNG